jgi:Clostripain family
LVSALQTCCRPKTEADMEQTKQQGNNQQPLKKWTFMVYLAGDNNLSEEMIFALKGMHTVGSTNDVQVVAWSDTIGALVPFDIPPKRITLVKTRSNPKRVSGKGASQTASAQTILVVTEDNDIKEKQEKFLTKRNKFKIKSSEAEIKQRQEVLFEEEEDIFEEREELGPDKTLKKAREAHEKQIKAFTERKAASLRERRAASLTDSIGEARLVRRKPGTQTPPASPNKKRGVEDSEDERDALRLETSQFATEMPVADILKAFMIDSVKRYPAEHYALILSGHGSGAVGDFLNSDKQVFALSIPGLCEALTEVGTECDNAGKPKGEPWLDILGFDSCLMSMAEVAYEVRQSVRYMVAAEGFETATGWAYDRIIELLHKNKDLQPRKFASDIVDEHIKYYDDYTAADVSVDLSALAVKHLKKLVEELGPTKDKKASAGLAVLLKEGLQNENVKDAIVLAHWEAQGYKNEQYTDLWDFCDCLAKRTVKIRGKIASKITAACRRVQDAIQKPSKKRDSLVFRSRYCGAEFQHSFGVSIFFPWADLKDAAEVSEVDHYGQLAFAQDTEWDEFLREYFRKTIREPRGENGALRHSFMNCRPFLFTGPVDKEKPSGSKSFPYTPRSFPYTPRSFPYTPRSFPYTPRSFPYTPRSFPYTPRTSGGGGLQPPKIASMKNPAIDWFELKLLRLK